MDLSVFDHPTLLETLFFPRTASPVKNGAASGIIDGHIPVADDVTLGYRCFLARPEFPVVVFFHGNGEIAADYNQIASMFHTIGTSLLVIDFRGYGWSTGRPSVSALISDVEPLAAALPDLLRTLGVVDGARYVMGRSLGSIPAIQMAAQHRELFNGLIIESGFASVKPLLQRRGMEAVLQGQPDPIGNRDKVGTLDLPLLVIHGEDDMLIPVEQGQMLYDASPAQHKLILRLAGVGHNNLLLHVDQYFAKIREFLNLTATNDA